MKVTILGCGGSGGVPVVGGVVGGNWGACDPSNPRNRRRRVSILVEDGPAAKDPAETTAAEEGGTVLLVDASPDLRLQLLDSGTVRLDAVLFTHAHADHCHGVDELRSLAYVNRGPIDAFMDAQTRRELTAKFDYVFTSSCEPDTLYRPILNDRLIEGPFSVGEIQVTPFAQGHGGVTTLGFRFGPVAYSTDVVELDDAAFAALADVEVWIVDCLRIDPHPTHSHLAQTLAWIERVQPKRAILTHMNHQTDYEDLKSRCPANVEPGYDGLVIRTA